MNLKITERHRSKPAYIYVRQSSPGQVRHHQESTERQYALREKAAELGWNQAAIRTLDRDLGVSGAQMTGRDDFKTDRLAAGPAPRLSSRAMPSVQCEIQPGSIRKAACGDEVSHPFAANFVH